MSINIGRAFLIPFLREITHFNRVSLPREYNLTTKFEDSVTIRLSVMALFVPELYEV